MGKRVLHSLKSLSGNFADYSSMISAGIKSGLNNRGDNGTGCFEIEVRTGIAKFDNMIIVRF